MKKTSPMVWLAAWLILILVTGAALAQTSSRFWRTFDALDGVTADWIFEIAQTPDAALWFATDQGVLRFDGVWQEMNEGLSTDAVLALAVDASGALWAGTPHGLARWHDGEWVWQGKGTELENAVINDLLALPDGGLWAGGRDGLFLWSPETGWQRATGLPLTGVDQMALDARQGIWLAQAATLYRLGDDGWQEFVLGKADAGFGITAMAPDARGGMWAATESRGIAHIAKGRLSWETTRTGLPDNQVLALLTARDGTLWAGTRGGAARLGTKGWRSLTSKEGLASDVVSALFEDGDGVLWFGTTAGITRYDAATWQTWHGPGAPQGRITALALNGKELWAAQEHGQLFRFENAAWKRVSLRTKQRPLKLSSIVTLFIDGDGRLWIGTRTQGVVRLTGQYARQWRISDGLAENFVTAIAQGMDGTMWFGTRTAGLSRFDGKHWQSLGVEDGLPSNEITALVVDDAGALWVGTSEGVGRFDGEAWQIFTAADGLPGDNIAALAKDGSGAVWAAAWEGGLSRWQDGVWKALDGPSPAITGGIWAMTATGERMWIGTESGLVVHDGRSWQSYDRAHGYEVDQVYAVAGDDTGVYLGGDHGVMGFHPEQTPPTLSLAAVNAAMPEDGVITLDTDTSVQVAFQGNDIHSEPEDLVYLARLEGVDEGWRQGRRPLVTYPPLKPGDYLLHAQVRDAAMNYSSPLTLTLQVRRSRFPFILSPRDQRYFGLTLLGVAFFTLFVVMAVYAAWTTLLRWHMRQQAIERRFNPYIAGSPIRSRDMFFGREQLLRDLKASLAHNSMMLYGERRIGKTSLLYRLLEDLPRLEDKKFRFFPVFVDLEGTPEEAFFHHLMEGLLDALHDALTDFPCQQKLQYFLLSEQVPYTDRHMRRDLRQIIGHLKKHIEPAPRIIFLLDEADTLSSYHSLTQQQFRRILQDVFARNVGAVISGVYISKAWDRLESPWYNMFVEVIVPPLNRYEAEMLMRKPVLGFYEWDDDAVEFVWRRTHGRPHRIQQIAREAVNLMLDDGRRRITVEDVRRGYERVVFAEQAPRALGNE